MTKLKKTANVITSFLPKRHWNTGLLTKLLKETLCNKTLHNNQKHAILAGCMFLYTCKGKNRLVLQRLVIKLKVGVKNVTHRSMAIISTHKTTT